MSYRATKERSAMGEILQNWIHARLGAMIDLSPEAFGHYTRDGTLLAQILHSYDIITRDQLETIGETQDPALCRVNLKHLKFWLRFLGIDCDDESIAEISCGKGATSLRLFYKLYLCLEGKDRLHLITLQKEREKFVPTSKKFEVSTVPEDPEPYEPSDHPLCAKLAKGTAEARRFEVPSSFRKVRRKREEANEPRISRPLENGDLEVRRRRKVSSWKRQTEELDRFARSRRARPERFATYDEEQRALEEERNRFARELERFKEDGEDPAAGRAYVDRLRDRAKRAATIAAIESRARNTLVRELWERMEARQERAFDEAIARRSLDQSVYEKRLVSKLCEVRERKNAIAENRRIVENMTLKANELEHRAIVELKKDLAERTRKDAEIEHERMLELRRRMAEEKIRKLRGKHYNMCRRLVKDLTSVALNVGEYRRVNDGHVPRSLLGEWKTMFLERQPIVDETFSELVESREFEGEDWEYREWCASVTRAEAQREILFDDYLATNPPWKEFVPTLSEEERETRELGRAVLGYAVHRLLNAVYPRPPNRARRSLARFKTAAILLGVADSALHRSIRALIERNGIRLVRIEDAINYCLGKYKEEMSHAEYIDSEGVGEAARKRSDHGASNDRPNDGSSRSRIDQKESSTRRDKETQTPREIPYDDLHPVLTDAAYIGKWVYEFLALGEPISDQLITKVLVEYLKSVTDAKRWALIDYPNTYEQMSLLEMALTGATPPADPGNLDFRDVTIEEIDSVPRRIVFEDEEDPFASRRRSRLLPEPIVDRDAERDAGAAFVDLFVRVAEKPGNFRADRSYETAEANGPTIDGFYASRKGTTAYVLYYTSLDSNALKKLARLVIGEPLQSKPSEELFGDALKELDAGTEQRTVAGSRAPVVRRLLTEAETLEAESDDERRSVDYLRPEWTIESRPVRPGEPNWHWLDFPLAAGIAENLASLWERTETVYLESTKEMLYLKSVRVSRIVPYRDFVAKNAKDFVRRPDNKQDLLYEFHMAYNAIDPDARHDADAKCELHRRVADFQATLWDICDARKREAETERRRLIDDRWTVLEAAILHNVFLGLLQAELDRFVDTMRLIEDYYLGMLKKPLPESTGSRPVLNRIETEEARFDEAATREGSRANNERTDRKPERSGRKSAGAATSSATATIGSPPAAVELELLRRQIDDALIDDRRRVREPDEIWAFRGVSENARYARDVVDALSATANELIKRERLAASRLGKYPLSDSIDSIVARTATRGEDLVSEWSYAVTFETDRVRSMIDAVIGVARADLFFLLNTTQRTFGGIREAIVDRYRRETNSVYEMGRVFRLAIEEGRMIENEMLLEDGDFVIRSNVFVTEVLPKTSGCVVAKESATCWRFRVADLARLTEIFQRVAPYGTVSERAFVYVLQDLVSHGRDEDESMLLPSSWYLLRGSQVSELVRCLFGDVDHVDWRQLIVYALELPWPSCRDLLIARERFRAQDPDARETVTRAQYYRTPLWFLERPLDDADMPYHLLPDDLPRNAERPCDDEPYRSVLDSRSPSFASHDSSSTSSGSLRSSCSKQQEETLRRTLAKELLCRMYAVDRRTVNYTALLLAFCKHDDPVEGFAKAIALAIGSRVCTDTDEGERHVQEIYERKRLGLSWQKMSSGEALETTKRILDRLIDRATASCSEEEESDESFASTDCRRFSSIDFEAEAISFTESSTSIERRDAESIVYWLSRDLCLTVLAATLPWHVLRPEIFGKHSNLRDSLSAVYAELRDERLNARKNVALAHRLLNHDFMKRLLNSVSNFTVKNIGHAVKKLLRVGERTRRSIDRTIPR